MKILFVSREGSFSSGFIDRIARAENTEIMIIDTGTLALEFLNENNFDLAVAAETLTDMTGIEFIKKLVLINPMINTAVVSNLSKKAFHEATEGLGVLMSIPVTATAEDAEGLLNYLYKINCLTSI